jgi:hypothetical protein
MVQTMPSPSQLQVEMWRISFNFFSKIWLFFPINREYVTEKIFFFHVFFAFVRNFAQINMAGGRYTKHQCWQT